MVCGFGGVWAQGEGESMTREDLLLRLWRETSLLVVPRRPDGHDGRTGCLCRWCSVSGTLRLLDEQFGLDLAMEEQRRIEASKVGGE